MSKFPTVTHVIFDLDGLMLDTEPIFTKVNNECLGKYGKTFTWEIKQKQLGRTHDDAIQVLLDHTGLAAQGVTVAEYDADYNHRLHALFPTAQVLPGVHRLITHLATHNIPMAVCTGSPSDAYQLKVSEHAEMMALFTHVVCTSTDPDVARGKPAPDGFLVCSKRFANPPAGAQHVLVFEDAPNGVEAARAAHMQVCMVPDPRVSDNVRKEATVCLKSLEKFDPSEFGLPPF